MSGEFRWIERAYMYGALEQAASEVGTEPLSKALTALYAALKPLEEACAYVEACDSGPDHITLTCHREKRRLQAAVREVMAVVGRECDLVESVVRATKRDAAEQEARKP